MKTILQNKARRSLGRGVTLLEVLVTVAILSLLATMIGFKIYKIHIEEQQKIARLNASSLRRLVAVWRLNRPAEQCPSVAGLVADGVADRETSSTDPWGSPYLITCGPDDVTVSSFGPDRRRGTGDDIVAPPETTVANVP
jgi:prepilin-type N-terminal cleavage/methylation domain-containing protein